MVKKVVYCLYFFLPLAIAHSIQLLPLLPLFGHPCVHQTCTTLQPLCARDKRGIERTFSSPCQLYNTGVCDEPKKQWRFVHYGLCGFQIDTVGVAVGTGTRSGGDGIREDTDHNYTVNAFENIPEHV